MAVVWATVVEEAFKMAHSKGVITPTRHPVAHDDRARCPV